MRGSLFRMWMGCLSLAGMACGTGPDTGGERHEPSLQRTATPLRATPAPENPLAKVPSRATGSFTPATPSPAPLRSPVVAMAAGTRHMLTLKQDGTLWAWGDNSYGQLGTDAAQLQQPSPTQLTKLSGVRAIAAGEMFSLALLQDGTLWSWGQGGRLGDGSGSTTSRRSPARIPALSGVISVSAAGSHALAAQQDGTVWAWGSNTEGESGNDRTWEYTLTASQVPGLTGVRAVAAGDYHSLALKQDGTVWAWGQNAYGQLGNGTTLLNRPTPTPVQVAGLSDVIAIAAGEYHSLALKRDGTVWAWGCNATGQLGDGTETARSLPTRVYQLTKAVSILAGGWQSFAVRDDGSLWAWGHNTFGQLGDGTTLHRSRPVRVQGLTSPVVAATTFMTLRGYLTCTVTLVALADGSLQGWGNDGRGHLADGAYLSFTPVSASDLGTPVSLEAGSAHVLALLSDGTVRAWGAGNEGQLGDGSYSWQRTTPVTVQGLSGVTAISAGERFSLALKSDGTVWAWGINDWGQLGNASPYSNGNASPAQVPGLSNIIAIATGPQHALALRRDGTVWGWGENVSGQLGDGTLNNRRSPIQVPGLAGVVALAAGRSHSLALTRLGTVWAWGDGAYRSFSDSAAANRTAPFEVTGIPRVLAMATGYSHSLLLLKDGTVLSVGYDAFNGLSGSFTPVTAPTHLEQVQGLSGVTFIAAGDYHSLAIKSDGTVWSWGQNAYGQLGDGTGVDRPTPVQMLGVGPVTAVSGSGQTSLLLGEGGTVLAVGSNTFGQLGDGRTLSRLTPYPIQVP